MSLTKEQCDDFWARADKNGDGELTIQELAAAVRQYIPKNPPPNYRAPTSQDIVCMFTGIDKDGDKKITKAEFMTEMMKPSRSQTLAKLFKEMDQNGDGTLSRAEIISLLKSSGTIKGSNFDEQADAIIKSADTSGDGAISFDEFMKALE